MVLILSSVLVLSAPNVIAVNNGINDIVDKIKQAPEQVEEKREQLKEKLAHGNTLRVIVHLKPDENEQLDLQQLQNIAVLKKRVLKKLSNAMTLMGKPNSLKAIAEFKYSAAFVIEINKVMYDILSLFSEVEAISEDMKIEASLARSVPSVMGEAMTVPRDCNTEAGHCGEGQTVVVMDGGIDPDHSFFEKRLLDDRGGCFSSNASYTYTDPETGNTIVQENTSLCANGTVNQTGEDAGTNCIPIYDDDNTWSSCDHGTHVTGIIAGNSEEAGLNSEEDCIPIYDGEDCIPIYDGEDDEGCIPIYDDDNTWSSCDDGTYVTGNNSEDVGEAGVIDPFAGQFFYGMAPKSKIVPINVFYKYVRTTIESDTYLTKKETGVSAYMSSIILALEYVLDLINAGHSIDVVNMSLGAGVYGSYCDNIEEFYGMKSLIDDLKSEGVAVAVASGNNGSNYGISFPACLSNVMSVGATSWYQSDTEEIADYSNRTSILDLLAPGTFIYSSIFSDDVEKWGFKSGTSMAAPHVAGAFAILGEAFANDYIDKTDRVDCYLSVLKATGTAVSDTDSDLAKPRIQVGEALNADFPVLGLTDDDAIAYQGYGGVIDVLANDDNSAVFQIASYTQPDNGSVSQYKDLFFYIPNDGFTGADQFTYTVGSCAGSESATVTVEVIDALTVGKDDDEYEYSTIQSALDAASSGDTVLVYPGLYEESIVFPADKENITLTSIAVAAIGRVGPNEIVEDTIIKHPGNSEIDGEPKYTPVVTIAGASAQLIGFTIGGGAYSRGDSFTVHGAAIYIDEDASNTLIQGNMIKANRGAAPGIYGKGPSEEDEDALAVIIDKNIFSDNHCLGYELSSGGVISLKGKLSLEITNNKFRDNQCIAVNMPRFVRYSTPLVINNTFYNNTIAIKTYSTSGAVHTYRNNLIYHNTIGVERYSNWDAEEPLWEHNLVYDNTVDYKNMSDYTGTNGNLSTDPVLEEDLSLSAHSPAIDAGYSESAPSDDIEGKKRPIDGDEDGVNAYDIGAYEYAP